jgi:hypothetical protein
MECHPSIRFYPTLWHLPSVCSLNVHNVARKPEALIKGTEAEPDV